MDKSGERGTPGLVSKVNGKLDIGSKFTKHTLVAISENVPWCWQSWEHLVEQFSVSKHTERALHWSSVAAMQHWQIPLKCPKVHTLTVNDLESRRLQMGHLALHRASAIMNLERVMCLWSFPHFEGDWLWWINMHFNSSMNKVILDSERLC